MAERSLPIPASVIAKLTEEATPETGIGAAELTASSPTDGSNAELGHVPDRYGIAGYGDLPSDASARRCSSSIASICSASTGLENR